MAFAWEGISLDLNDDWAPTTISGQRSAGYVKLGDGSHRAIQIRWQELRGAVDLEGRLRTYLKVLDRDSRKQKQSISYDIEPVDNGIAYRYQGPISGRGIASIEIDPTRVVFAEVSSHRSERISNQHKTVLSTIKSAEHDDQELWSVLGLSVRLPLGSIPVKRDFVSGKTRIIWKRNKDVIEAQRWGLASQLLARYDLADWARSVTNLPVIESTPTTVTLEKRHLLGDRAMAIAHYQPDTNQITLIKVISRRESSRPEASWIA